MIEHADMVDALVKPGDMLMTEATPHKMVLIHMAVGISGESGELLDAIKKHVFYDKALDHENVVEELGDIEFYLEGLRQAVGVTRDEVLKANMDKLSKRYPSFQYSNQRAQERADKNA